MATAHPAPQPLPRILTADEIIPTVQHSIENSLAAQQAIPGTVTVSTACFENVVRPLAAAENDAEGVKNMLGLLRKVSPEATVRDAATEAQKLLSTTTTEQQDQSRRLCVLLTAVKDKNEPLDQESRKLLEGLFRDHSQKGGGRENQDIAKITKEIKDLCSAFQTNLRDEEGGLWFTEEELSGLPPRHLQGFRPGDESSQPGKRLVTFRSAHYLAVLKYADSPETRRRMHIANAKKLPENVPLFKSVVRLRDKKARLLGYANHAELMMESRLAKSTQWVMQYLQNFRDGLLPLAGRDMEMLAARKRLHLEENGVLTGQLHREILPWDIDYYARLVEEDLGLNQTLISEYFPSPYTIPAVLRLFSGLFAIEFVLVPAAERSGCTWHDDVEIWAAWDITAHEDGPEGDFLGYLYLDLLQRDNKFPGEINVPLVNWFQKPDGARSYPSTVVLASFARPTETSCTLLTHREVKAFLHELGHAIHDLLGNTKYARFSGANTSRDFVETPSLMLENWSWMKDVLKAIGCHFTSLDPGYKQKWQQQNPGAAAPPAEIPDKLLASLARTRTLNKARKMLAGLAPAIFDIKVHSPATHEECIELDETALYNDLVEELSLYKVPDRDERGHSHVNFGHLVGTYDVGYYSYALAQAFADDMFKTVFANDPFDRAAWTKYRQEILEPGGGRDELEMLEAFLGRPSDPDATLWSLSVVL